MAGRERSGLNLHRLSPELQEQLKPLYNRRNSGGAYLEIDTIHQGDALDLLPRLKPNSVSLSVWSPPYFVGKEYEAHLDFDAWKALLSGVVARHFPIIKPGGFLAINIADILVFRDPEMPRIQAEVVGRKRCPVDAGGRIAGHGAVIPAAIATSWQSCWDAASRRSTAA